jgi:hypothetical protein
MDGSSLRTSRSPGGGRLAVLSHPRKKRMDPNSNIQTYGVSLHKVQQILKDNPTFENLSTKEIVDQHIIPETSKNKCRYLDILSGDDRGHAQYFVSHVWDLPFSFMVGCLRSHFAGQEPKKIFLWIDIFAVNQHGGDQMDYDLNNLERRIEQSSQTLVCLDQNGKVLTRIWCLFEMWKTVSLPQGSKRLVSEKLNLQSDLEGHPI